MPVTTFESRAARENWRDVLDATTSGQSDVVITRYGKPVTVMIRYEDYLAVRDELLRVRAEQSETFQTMLASEAVLARDWNTPEEDEAWADL
ncbi:MAG: type II toxin-antitoxin system prevent-host-death family antitoxin [Caldilineaceae bacterium]|nr:type II toxin-antitoxin system prevent-host-death family antitoxin [Caldilineaceae bacterium]